LGKAEAEERSINGWRPVWPCGNNTFVPALGTAHLDLRLAMCGFSSLNRGWVGFHKQSIFEPGEPQCVNACGFFAVLPEATKATGAGADPQRAMSIRPHRIKLNLMVSADLRTYIGFARIGDQPYGRIRISANFVANAPTCRTALPGDERAETL
jgi:hypothetical protein